MISLPFNVLLGGMPLIFVLMFALVLGMILFRIIQGIIQWNKNNESPVLTVSATVVTKREEVRHFNNTGSDGMIMSSSSTLYYVTFEVTGGDRLEFKVQGKEYGTLAEHDRGMLTYQGTRYLGFERS